jgi:hypothetical protein
VRGVVLDLAFRPDHISCLPTVCRSYLSMAKAAQHRRGESTRPEPVIERLTAFCNHALSERFHAAADRAYRGQSELTHLPSNGG